MEPKQAVRIAHEELDRHVPNWRDSWEVKLTDARKYAGQCTFRGLFSRGPNRLSLSRPFVKVNDEEQVRCVVLHEVAHVLGGDRAGHGPQWKSIALRIGGPRAALVCTDGQAPPPRWVATCEKCGYSYPTNTRRKNARCRAPLPHERTGSRSHLYGTCDFGTFAFKRYEED